MQRLRTARGEFGSSWISPVQTEPSASSFMGTHTSWVWALGVRWALGAGTGGGRRRSRLATAAAAGGMRQIIGRASCIVEGRRKRMPTRLLPRSSFVGLVWVSAGLVRRLKPEPRRETKVSVPYAGFRIRQPSTKIVPSLIPNRSARKCGAVAQTRAAAVHFVENAKRSKFPAGEVTAYR